jgi:prepilin-type N-terminal cleavage/methylation domain-containing protein
MARPSRRGFTLIELLLTVSLATFGFVGLFNLQASTLRGLENLRRLQEATWLAENFIEMMRVELMSWVPRDAPAGSYTPIGPHIEPVWATNPVDGVTTTGDLATGWKIADLAASSDRRMSSVGDLWTVGAAALNDGTRGAMLSPGLPEEPFCLLYRMMWIKAPYAARLEVEVSWPLETADLANFMSCDQNAGNRLAEARSVTLTSVVATNFFKR